MPLNKETINELLRRTTWEISVWGEVASSLSYQCVSSLLLGQISSSYIPHKWLRCAYWALGNMVSDWSENIFTTLHFFFQLGYWKELQYHICDGAVVSIVSQAGNNLPTIERRKGFVPFLLALEWSETCAGFELSFLSPFLVMIIIKLHIIS